MELQNYYPRSRLVTKTTQVEKPRFPAFDAHNHLGEDFGGGWDKRPLPELLDLLDQAGVVHYVALDGGWGEPFLNAHSLCFPSSSCIDCVNDQIRASRPADLLVTKANTLE